MEILKQQQKNTHKITRAVQILLTIVMQFTCNAWRAASAESRDENVTKPTGCNIRRRTTASPVKYVTVQRRLLFSREIAIITSLCK